MQRGAAEDVLPPAPELTSRITSDPEASMDAFVHAVTDVLGSNSDSNHQVEMEQVGEDTGQFQMKVNLVKGDTRVCGVRRLKLCCASPACCACPACPAYPACCACPALPALPCPSCLPACTRPVVPAAVTDSTHGQVEITVSATTPGSSSGGPSASAGNASPGLSRQSSNASPGLSRQSSTEAEDFLPPAALVAPAGSEAVPPDVHVGVRATLDGQAGGAGAVEEVEIRLSSHVLKGSAIEEMQLFTAINDGLSKAGWQTVNHEVRREPSEPGRRAQRSGEQTQGPSASASADGEGDMELEAPK